VLLVVLIGIGYHAPQPASGIAANAAATPTVPTQSQSTVDDVVATPIAANVANLSISTQIKSEIPQSSDATTISKPQIVQPTAGGRTITSYTAVAGDTAQSVAAKYNISADTVKWANNLTSDALDPGKSLQILPVSGITYTAQSGDTVQSVATKYQADASRITVYNDLDDSGTITAGMKLIIPDGILPTNERPGYVAPVTRSTSSYTTSYSFQAGSVGNRYAFGNCTWYAYERRAQLGRPVGSFWGNAATWNIAAAGQGFLVDHNPAPGAVYQIPAYGDNATGGAGHVGIVESVNPDGSIIVSEMNYAGHFDQVTTRPISAGQAALYNYIH
jgi:N-acetylmuramoyl-L-alanine amidase